MTKLKLCTKPILSKF